MSPSTEIRVARICQAARSAFTFRRLNQRRLAVMEAWLAARVGHDEQQVIVNWAREQYRLEPGIEVAVDEAVCRPHPEGIQVRCWCLVDSATIAALQTSSPSLRAAIAAMDPLTRAIIFLRMHHGLSGREISQCFGIGRRTVRRHLRNAVRAVAATLDESDEPEL
jgi:DNA-directed RNA polymerase specialized sigma24 family protein